MKGRTNIKNSSILEYWRGDELNQIRDTMLAGSIDIPGCTICYHNERSIGKSTRTEALNDYKIFNEQHYTKLIDYYGCLTKQSPSILEMHLGNTCNLKCLTCRPEDSSMFLQENKALGISNHNQSDYMLDSKIINDTIDSVIDDLAVLDLRGGESLLIPSIKKKLQSMPIDSCNTKTLRVQTNGTLLNDAWKDIFKKFQSVEIMISIDAFDDDNAYIRYPADWSQIEATVDYFKSIHCKIYINCTISNLNFLLLDKLLHWARSREI
jgi:sulfatase maturation enzyme AslB (radical SAM superfamily)